MKENKMGDYEKSNKLKCYKCHSFNIVFIETSEKFQDKIGFESGFVISRKKIVKVGIFHCSDCNRLMAFPIPYAEDTNQTSTTFLNTYEENKA